MDRPVDCTFLMLLNACCSIYKLYLYKGWMFHPCVGGVGNGAVTMHGLMIGCYTRPLGFSETLAQVHEGHNQTRTACCSETRKGSDEKVTGSAGRADQGSRHLLFSTAQRWRRQLLLLGASMIPLS